MNRLKEIHPRQIINILGLLGLGSLFGSVFTFSALLTEANKIVSFEPVSAQQLPVSAQALINGERLALEVAKTAEEQAIGLMFREHLPADRGMLFVISKPRTQIIWTKALKFPIDAVFMLDGEVQYVASLLPPCGVEPCPTYGTSVEVDQVLTMRGGRAEELGIDPGQQIMIQNLDLAMRGDVLERQAKLE